MRETGEGRGPGQARGKRERRRDRGREWDREKGGGESERGGWEKGENVVDRLSTVNVSYPRVDCNSG